MEFRDLKKQYKVLKNDIDQAMLEVSASGAFIMGKPVKEIEQQLAEYVGVKHCVSCANGTDALTLALKTWGIKAGDAVFVPDFTFFASAEVVSLEGATPVFVDVDADTFNISPASLERSIEKTIQQGKLRPKVIITVDLFGLPADYSAIRKIADKYHLLILEDGAQGFGGEINGKKACSFGDISTTSFFPAKPLGCYGDGGAVFTDNDEWASLMDSLRVHGKGSFKYDNVRIGMNSRLDTLQAAILKVKFDAFRKYELNDINKVADFYTEKLKDLVKTPFIPKGYLSSWAQYTIQLQDEKQRDGLQAYLKEQGIPTMVYYPKPMHEQTAYLDLGNLSGDFSVTESLCRRVLSLPMHPYLSMEEINKVCQTILDYLK
ncbi:MAG TPA: DegT/DnrJ/EryC1/StrS family aminotransferase [Paludibacteraceae bacterium]|nr:DegT/DnrJ/EryC1/StrS family aminotransferase [Paludibacteraceae bacterium]HON02297.1 DegT/DnrJ/EryC1/StrS family aminotransferase [Paludibacteraceae bacterium]HPD59230.1 DegT/DnrJ/EryC1/StrS family aminotransferase [Paludibacteraceae bacterium]HPQ12181.1 DegT/DnrJ/EryC1/StrS family aminotransferase [Paludibacteraceae bacterium]HRS23741.1 DegT/DnrJ/EryC1/StrS family aminotransferase [Paludibacteraceae bacterium]